MHSIFKESKTTFILATPIIAGQVSQMLLGLADTLMIGRVGTVELAAAAFANVLFHIPFFIAIGLTAAVSIQIAHAHGKAEHRAAADTLRHGVLLSVLAGIALSICLLGLLPFLALFQQPEEVTAITPEYLRWLAFSLIPMVPALAIKSFAEAKNHPWPVFWIFLGGVALNIVLNYILIFGNWGFPPMGLAGAGIATFIARCITLLLLAVYLKRSRTLRESLPDKWLRALRRAEIFLLAKIGSPIAGQLLLEFGAFAMAALLVGQFGSVALAAHQIALTCAASTFMLPLGLSMALTIRVGHVYGSGARERCRSIIAGAHIAAFLIMSSCALAYIVAGDSIASLFIEDPAVIALTATMLVVTAFFQIFDGAQIISMGALRGMRDVNWPTVTAFFSFWIVGIPFGAWLAFGAGVGAIGLWIGLAAALAFAAATLSVRLTMLLRVRQGGVV